MLFPIEESASPLWTIVRRHQLYIECALPYIFTFPSAQTGNAVTDVEACDLVPPHNGLKREQVIARLVVTPAAGADDSNESSDSAIVSRYFDNIEMISITVYVFAQPGSDLVTSFVVRISLINFRVVGDQSQRRNFVDGVDGIDQFSKDRGGWLGCRSWCNGYGGRT